MTKAAPITERKDTMEKNIYQVDAVDDTQELWTDGDGNYASHPQLLQ